MAGLSGNIAISAFNWVEVEVEAELGNINVISDALAVYCCIIMLLIMVCVVFWSINGDLVLCVAVGTGFINYG